MITTPREDCRQLRLIDWKPGPSGALVGRAAVEIAGLVITDIGIFTKDGRRWAQLPSEPTRDRDGHILKGERGKARYRSPIKWKTRELQERFSAALIAAIEPRYGSLGGGGP